MGFKFWDKTLEIWEVQEKRISRSEDMIEKLIYSEETLERKVKTLELEIETLKNDYKKALSKYNEFLFEKDEYIKTIRDRIEKKLDYHNSREPEIKKNVGLNALMKQRIQDAMNKPKEPPTDL